MMYLYHIIIVFSFLTSVHIHINWYFGMQYCFFLSIVSSEQNVSIMLAIAESYELTV